MRAPSPLRVRGIARLLLTVAAVSAVVVLAAAIVAPSIPMPAEARTIVDAARFIGPPLALLTGALALLHARRRERRGDRREPRARHGRDRVPRHAPHRRGLMALGILSALWSAAVLAVGDLLR